MLWKDISWSCSCFPVGILYTLPTKHEKNSATDVDWSKIVADIAHSIALAIKGKQQKGEKIVLGLATGSSPLKVYSELIRMHREEGLSFHNVVTFNLDEYYPILPDNIESYHYFMHEYLFNHIDNIPREC